MSLARVELGTCTYSRDHSGVALHEVQKTVHACLRGHIFAMTLQAQSNFDKELDSLRSQILAAQENMRLIGGNCNAFKKETRQAVEAHADAVKVSLHSNLVDLLVLLLLVDSLCMRLDIMGVI